MMQIKVVGIARSASYIVVRSKPLSYTDREATRNLHVGTQFSVWTWPVVPSWKAPSSEGAVDGGLHGGQLANKRPRHIHATTGK